MIAATGIHKRFARRTVLRDVSLTASAGEMIAILGENGGGKSTLLAILAGALRPDAGHVRLAGRAALCPQDCVLYATLTPDEHFALFGTALGLAADEIALRATALFETFGFAQHRATVVEALSGGTRQKLNLALALLADPPLLLLDEPYNGFDVETYHRFLDWSSRARDEGRCIVVVTHIAFDRERFDRLLMLENGSLRAA